MDDWVYWMALAVVMAGIELVVFTIFIFGPLALAATATAIVAGFGAPMEVQLAVFIVLSIVSIAAMYPVSKRYRETVPELASNVDALIGREARVLEELSGDTLGLIRFDNSNWTARPSEGIATIAAETRVRVVSIAGATAIVEPIEEQSTPDS